MKKFIQNVFEFDDLTADEVLTHRTDIIMLDLDDSIDTWNQIIMKNRFTIYPICDQSADRIIGILNIKDYFRLEKKDKDYVLQHGVKPAYFVPETGRADVLFKNMKDENQEMAIVLDEYGGFCGTITMNDLLTELVGDLEKEEEPFIEKINEYRRKIHGSTWIEDMEEELQIVLHSDEYETFNGFVFHMMGSIPQDGTEFELETNELHIRIIKVKNHQVEIAIVSFKK